jgi:sugar lactone lactonase YvrE
MGVAVGLDGRIYVTEAGGERMVHIYNRQGEELGSFAPPEDLAPDRIPVYVAVSPDGDIYVSDSCGRYLHLRRTADQGRSPLQWA